ncbi:MAG: hypothetical protein KAT34_08990, partial [Candidatus Aminicenantes bacterium]|nr:hypothetical protein [Candidatus Aminicenantes bacterium]
MHRHKLPGNLPFAKASCRIIPLLILFACISTPLLAGTIEGVIQNVNFKSIDTAKIHLKETGQYFFSKKNGTFEIPV